MISINKITELLKNNNEVKAYEIIQSDNDSRELFFVLSNLEINRAVKVTTIVVLFAYLHSELRRSTSINMFKRSIGEDVIRRASLVCIINLTLAVSASLIIIGMQGFDMTDTFFEIFSAVSTVGMSAGLTGQLNTLSCIIVILIMYLGRIGSLSFALSFTDAKNAACIAEPHEDINVG